MQNIFEYTPFLDKAFQTLNENGIDVSSYELDHFAWQCETDEEYDLMKPEILKIGREICEEMVSNRRVGVFELLSPIKYKNYSIIAVELISPKEGKVLPSGYQHLEFVIDFPFQELMDKYPQINWNTDSINRGDFAHLVIDFENGVSVKFHHDDIISTIEKNIKK